jgi:hypothetical protein
MVRNYLLKLRMNESEMPTSSRKRMVELGGERMLRKW